jgi:hypothetical protein
MLWFGLSFKILTQTRHEKKEKFSDRAVMTKQNTSISCDCNVTKTSCPTLKAENPIVSISSLDANTLLYLTNTNTRLPLASFQDHKLSPLTRWTQSFIYNHQHPTTCNKDRLLISDGYMSGFGSEMHVIGTHLAYAIQSNLVLVLSPKSCVNFRTPSNCTQGCSCMLRPLTNCGQEMDIFENLSIPHIQNTNSYSDYLVPDVIVKKLKEVIPSMTEHQIKYWWRGQSVAYLMRFNDQTMDAIYNLRRKLDLHYITGGGSVPFPLPPGTISAHIRGGDKYYEMTLVSAREFVEAVKKMILSMPNSFSRVIFMSGDDQASIDEARKLTEEANMTFIYTRMPRPTGGHNINIASWRSSSAHDTSESSFYGHLMQLFMNLEADAWVGTRGSNWNRLIDELRCIFVDKCQGMFVEVGKEGPEQESTYFW